MIGEVVIARIPLLDADGMMLVKLHAVEANDGEISILWLSYDAAGLCPV
jgi:hypothetical protein